MANNSEYKARISQHGWDALLNLWYSIETGETSDWEPGRALEYLVLRAFELDGLEISWPYNVQEAGKQLEQIDGAVYLGELGFLVECKDEQDRVNIGPIAKLQNQLSRRPPATMGIVFSRSGFTAPAEELTQRSSPQRVLLWEGVEVAYALQNRVMRESLALKYHKCVEYGLPNYDIRVGS